MYRQRRDEMCGAREKSGERKFGRHGSSPSTRRKPATRSTASRRFRLPVHVGSQHGRRHHDASGGTVSSPDRPGFVCQTLSRGSPPATTATDRLHGEGLGARTRLRVQEVEQRGLKKGVIDMTLALVRNLRARGRQREAGERRVSDDATAVSIISEHFIGIAYRRLTGDTWSLKLCKLRRSRRKRPTREHGFQLEVRKSFRGINIRKLWKPLCRRWTF